MTCSNHRTNSVPPYPLKLLVGYYKSDLDLLEVKTLKLKIYNQQWGAFKVIYVSNDLFVNVISTMLLLLQVGGQFFSSGSPIVPVTWLG